MYNGIAKGRKILCYMDYLWKWRKKLPGGGNENVVGQFIECLNIFWMNGGALVFWCDNEPLTYEANLFLEKAELPGEYSKSNIRFVGNHYRPKRNEMMQYKN